MSKNKKEEVVGNIRLVCHKYKWSSFKPSCDKILSIQNCLNFFGTYQPCDCFEMQELDIKERELDRIKEMILEAEDVDESENELEVKIADEDEPPLPDTPRRKRRRRRKKVEIVEE